MEKLVAKIVMGHDIAHMYSNENRPGTCPICHNTIEKIPDPLYKVPKKKGDMFYTYDGFCIVSENFKSFCDERVYPHLTFVPLTKSVGYYFFVPQDIYKLDYIRRNVQFIDKRTCCGCYDEVIGMSPSYKKIDFSTPTNDFICRSEYNFGSYGCKSPLIIVGLDTAAVMKSYGLKGICYDKVLL
ncbi:hypothetical protein K6V25_05630 [Bacteroides salyersiae]|uniref:hypothetical protein n=1 Tax=Bacteroides salyersiae TaxID=291644 RepID=UPI001CC9228A|nr:hypothetical protein [Bacteroides salyersiae]UBD66307.1 hypothetical protein K6V25_05630 [Bacteroides salyersiae]